MRFQRTRAVRWKERMLRGEEEGERGTRHRRGQRGRRGRLAEDVGGRPGVGVREGHWGVGHLRAGMARMSESRRDVASRCRVGVGVSMGLVYAGSTSREGEMIRRNKFICFY